MEEEIKISEMLEAENINEEDFIPIIQNGINKKIRASKVGTGSGEVTVVDSLNSTSRDDALSAYMGRQLRLMLEEVDETTNYSTNETKVGTWINGKTLYKKTFIANNGSIDISDLNCDFVTIKNFMFKTAQYVFVNNRYRSTNDVIEIYIDYTNKKVKIETTSQWTNYTAYVTIEYTKTTDID